MCCTLYGAHSKSTASALNCLAIGQKKNGDPAAAEETYRRALSVYEEIYGKDAQNLSIAAVLHNLGVLYEDQRDHARAKDYYKRALDIRLVLLGDHNKDTAASWGHYGLICGRLGDCAYGEACCRKELTTTIDLFGNDHIRTADAFYRIGCLYAIWTRYGQAREAFSKALEIQQEKLGDTNPDTIRTKEELEKLPS